jgi:hypothetical protein
VLPGPFAFAAGPQRLATAAACATLWPFFPSVPSLPLQGEAKPHVFTQFWLQFPKLEAGFVVLRQQLEARTGTQEGPLPLAVLESGPQDFGIDDSSLVMRELCSKAVSHKCTEVRAGGRT